MRKEHTHMQPPPMHSCRLLLKCYDVKNNLIRLELKFNMATDNHGKVYVNSKGKRVLRVSEVIKMLGKEQIAIWANMLGFKHIRYRDELERTANIGSMVHAILEDFSDETSLTAIDRFDDFGIYNYSDKLEASNALQSFFSWYEKNYKLYKVIDTEVELVGEEYGGTTDIILQSPWHADRVLIGDYKTAKAVYFSMFLQAGAYISLYEEKHGEKSCDGAVIFQLDKKRGEKARPKFIDRKSMQKYIDAFQALLQVALHVHDIEKEFEDDMEPFTVKYVLE